MTPNIKQPKDSVFKTPNTQSLYYGKDIPESHGNVGDPGKDRYSLHLTQTTDWSQIPVTYDWNSMGLRCPETDYSKSTRLLFIGGSQCLGVGMPLEMTYPYLLAQKMDASYINLSDFDVLTDSIEVLKTFTDYNPTHILVSDTRFIQTYGFVINALSRNHLAKIYDNSEYMDTFKKCDYTALTMFELSLIALFPNSRLIFAGSPRRLFGHGLPEFIRMESMLITRDDVIDLARDNTHFGIESHKRVSERLYSSITSLTQRQ